MIRTRPTNKLPELPATPRRLLGVVPSFVVCLAPLIVPHFWIGLGMIGALVVSVGVAAFGTDVDARVLEAKTETRKKGTSYQVRYAYVVDGRTLTEQDGISGGLYARVSAPGATIRVRHFELGAIHSAVVTDDKSAWAPVAMWLFVTCFWNGVVSVILYQVVMAPLRRRSLIVHGEETTGEVASRRTGQKNSLFATFRFHVPTSDEAIMVEMPVAKKEFESALSGTPVTVLFDPNKPSRAIAYELSGYVVET